MKSLSLYTNSDPPQLLGPPQSFSYGIIAAGGREREEEEERERERERECVCVSEWVSDKLLRQTYPSGTHKRIITWLSWEELCCKQWEYDSGEIWPLTCPWNLSWKWKHCKSFVHRDTRQHQHYPRIVSAKLDPDPESGDNLNRRILAWTIFANSQSPMEEHKVRASLRPPPPPHQQPLWLYTGDVPNQTIFLTMNEVKDGIYSNEWMRRQWHEDGGMEKWSVLVGWNWSNWRSLGKTPIKIQYFRTLLFLKWHRNSNELWTSIGTDEWSNH